MTHPPVELFFKDAWNWTVGAGKATGNWTVGAANATGSWTKGAANSIGNWTVQSAIDVGDFVQKDIPSWGVEQWQGIKRSGLGVKTIFDSATTGNWNGMLRGIETVWPIDDIKGAFVAGEGLFTGDWNKMKDGMVMGLRGVAAKYARNENMGINGLFGKLVNRAPTIPLSHIPTDKIHPILKLSDVDVGEVYHSSKPSVLFNNYATVLDQGSKCDVCKATLAIPLDINVRISKSGTGLENIVEANTCKKIHKKYAQKCVLKVGSIPKIGPKLAAVICPTSAIILNKTCNYYLNKALEELFEFTCKQMHMCPTEESNDDTTTTPLEADFNKFTRISASDSETLAIGENRALYRGGVASLWSVMQSPENRPVVDVTARGRGWIWVVTDDGGVHKCEKPCAGDAWVREGGGIAKVDADETHVWTVAQKGEIYRAPVAGGHRTLINGILKDISVGEKDIWGVNNQGMVWKCAKPCNGAWQRVTETYAGEGIDAHGTRVFLRKKGFETKLVNDEHTYRRVPWKRIRTNDPYTFRIGPWKRLRTGTTYTLRNDHYIPNSEKWGITLNQARAQCNANPACAAFSNNPDDWTYFYDTPHPWPQWHERGHYGRKWTTELKNNGIINPSPHISKWGITLDKARELCQSDARCKSFSNNPDDWTFFYDTTHAQWYHRGHHGRKWTTEFKDGGRVLLQQWGMTLEQARVECEKRPECKSFSWNPDDNTFLYDSDVEQKQHRGNYGRKWRSEVKSDKTTLYVYNNGSWISLGSQEVRDISSTPQSAWVVTSEGEAIEMLQNMKIVPAESACPAGYREATIDDCQNTAASLWDGKVHNRSMPLGCIRSQSSNRIVYNTYTTGKNIVNIRIDGMCLDGPERKAGGKLHMIPCDPTNNNQKFVHEKDTGLIRFADNSNFCVDAKDGGRPHVWSCSTSNNNQKWTYDANTKLLRAAQGKCLDNPGEERKTGGYVHMWDCDAANVNQTWTISGLHEKVCAPLDYKLLPPRKHADIECAASHGATVDADKSSRLPVIAGSAYTCLADRPECVRYKVNHNWGTCNLACPSGYRRANPRECQMVAQARGQPFSRGSWSQDMRGCYLQNDGHVYFNEVLGSDGSMIEPKQQKSVCVRDDTTPIFMCVPGVSAPVTTIGSDVACASNDGKNCLQGSCSSTELSEWDGDASRTLLCDEESYKNGNHWCAKVREESAISQIEEDYVVKKNTSMTGNSKNAGTASTPATCASVCDDDDDCVAFMWNRSNYTCTTMQAGARMNAEGDAANYVSGIYKNIYKGAFGSYEFATPADAHAKCSSMGLRLCRRKEVIVGAKQNSKLSNVCSSGWTSDGVGWYSVKKKGKCGGNNTWNTWNPMENGSKGAAAHCCGEGDLIIT